MACCCKGAVCSMLRSATTRPNCESGSSTGAGGRVSRAGRGIPMNETLLEHYNKSRLLTCNSLNPAPGTPRAAVQFVGNARDGPSLLPEFLRQVRHILDGPHMRICIRRDCS